MKLSGWRKIAGAMWGPPDDPQVYGILEFRDAVCRPTWRRRAGQAVERRVIPRETVDNFFIAAVEGGRELSGVRIDRTDHKSILDAADGLKERATAV